MFSRNEKYGQALHLQYGFDTKATPRATAPKTGLISKLRAWFTPMDHAANKNLPIEVTLDKNSIEQAVQMELRNTESAANENQLEMFKGKSA